MVLIRMVLTRQVMIFEHSMDMDSIIMVSMEGRRCMIIQRKFNKQLEKIYELSIVQMEKIKSLMK